MNYCFTFFFKFHLYFKLNSYEKKIIFNCLASGVFKCSCFSF